MAGNGPPPSENKRRRNADTYADVKSTVVNDGQLRGPALEGHWLAETRAWYDNWRRSPQAATFVSTDWFRLGMVARLVELYIHKPHHMTMAEIRQNESLLGATHVDRLRARIKVEAEAPKTATAPGVTALDDYRRDLAG